MQDGSVLPIVESIKYTHMYTCLSSAWNWPETNLGVSEKPEIP